MARLSQDGDHEIPLRHVENSVAMIDSKNGDFFQYGALIIDNSYYLPDFLDDIDYMYNFGYLTVTLQRNEGGLFDYSINLMDKELVISKLAGNFPEIDQFLQSEYAFRCQKSNGFCELLELT
ncbi:MAG: hypothetical protein U9O53_04565 [archaeon]|nr:hypothetical protein [archaeon]